MLSRVLFAMMKRMMRLIVDIRTGLRQYTAMVCVGMVLTRKDMTRNRATNFTFSDDTTSLV